METEVTLKSFCLCIPSADQKLQKEEVEAGGKWESQRMMALGPGELGAEAGRCCGFRGPEDLVLLMS